MSEFNVGDKVRLRNNGGYDDIPHGLGGPGFTFKGSVGTVVDNHQDWLGRIEIRVYGAGVAFGFDDEPFYDFVVDPKDLERL